MAADKGKIKFIANARCIGILLVVFGHSFPFDVYISPVLWKIKDFIYVFHMPLFLFISGYLLTENHRSPGEYIRRRGTRLLIPYFALSLVAFVPKAIMQRFLNDSVDFSIQHLVMTELVPRENVWGHFWYIPVVFFLCCFGVLALNHMRKSRVIQAAVLITTYVLLYLPETTAWFALEDVRKAAFYFVLGITLADWNPDTCVISKSVWLFAFPVAFVLFRCGANVLYNSVIALLMIGFILHIGTRLPMRKTGLFAMIEKYSFTIFLLSWPAQAVIEVVCNKVLHLPALLVMGMMSLAGIAVPLICVKIVSLIDKRISVKWVKLAIGM